MTGTMGRSCPALLRGMSQVSDHYYLTRLCCQLQSQLYVTAASHPGRQWAGQLIGSWGSGMAAQELLLLVSGIPTAPCTTPYGDLVLQLAVQNKQEWARLHGHEFHLMAQSVDPRMHPGPWQKMGMLRKVCY